jgi:hypothetical protein
VAGRCRICASLVDSDFTLVQAQIGRSIVTTYSRVQGQHTPGRQRLLRAPLAGCRSSWESHCRTLVSQPPDVQFHTPACPAPWSAPCGMLLHYHHPRQASGMVIGAPVPGGGSGGGSGGICRFGHVDRHHCRCANCVVCLSIMSVVYGPEEKSGVGIISDRNNIFA